MIDFARIVVNAGDGGRGAGSFRGLKGKTYGKADGGDAGDGGNVYIEASADLNSLDKYRFVKEYRAQMGQSGLSRLRRGAKGDDLVMLVPVGTQIKVDVAEGDVFDLTEAGSRILVARGGQGGRGNAHLKDEFQRRPKTGEVGTSGEIVNLTLELKLIADVGLIGLPNAGKSTLISKITAAKPKIAAYPFTTLEANLGVLELDGKRMVIADIPGLIEGASEGRGLGDLFLKHIERTKKLIHLIDLSQGGNLWDVYNTVKNELKNYSPELAKKDELVVLTKVDLVDKKTVDGVLAEFKKHHKKVMIISAQDGRGLDELVSAIFA